MMVSPVRFGQIYRAEIPVSLDKACEQGVSHYPPQLMKIHDEAQWAIAANVSNLNNFDELLTAMGVDLTKEERDSKPNTRTYLLVTDEDAFAIAQQQGLKVSPQQSKAENEAAFEQAQEKGWGFILEAYIKAEEAKGRQVLDLQA